MRRLWKKSYVPYVINRSFPRRIGVVRGSEFLNFAVLSVALLLKAVDLQYQKDGGSGLK